MKKTFVFAAFIVWIGIVSDLFALDTVRVLRNIDGIYQEASELGTVLQITSKEVVLGGRNDKETTIQTSQILWIRFDDEPISLTTARTLFLTGRYAEAVDKLGEITESEFDGLSENVRREIEFYRAVSAAKKATFENYNEQAFLQAGKALNDFVRDNPESVHFDEANEAVGTILLYLNKAKLAKPYFEKLTRTDLSERNLRAKIQIGNLAIGENDLTQARREFEDVARIAASESEKTELKKKSNDDLDELTEQKQEPRTFFQTQGEFAAIGLARLDGLEGRTDEGIRRLKELVETTDSKNVALQAALYNALGELYRLAGRDSDAVLAYLHVDLLYFASSLDDREALTQLHRLWKKLKRDDRAEEVRERIQEKFGVALE